MGANGQLGAACCRGLAAEGHVVRGSVRARSRAAGLDLGGADLVECDLTGPTIGRPSPFLRQFRRGTGSIVEKRGLMLVPGPTSRRQAFIAVADAEAACVAAVSRPELAGRTLDVGGPEVLTWDDVAAIFSRLLGRRVRAVSAPVGVFAVAAALLEAKLALPETLATVA